MGFNLQPRMGITPGWTQKIPLGTKEGCSERDGAWLCLAVCAKGFQSSHGPQRPQISPKILPCVKLSRVVHWQPRGCWMSLPRGCHRPPQPLAPTVTMLCLGDPTHHLTSPGFTSRGFSLCPWYLPAPFPIAFKMRPSSTGNPCCPATPRALRRARRCSGHRPAPEGSPPAQDLLEMP